MTKPLPRVYGVPHDKWREHQYETVRQILSGFKKNGKTRIVQAPTGSGKSAIATALSVNDSNSVRVVTHSLNLQEQYEDGYGFDAIYGMSHYNCAEWRGVMSADNCIYPEKMYSCPSAQDCEYLLQRNFVRESKRQILSYAYYTAAQWPSENQTKFIVFDEGHLLPDLTKDACTIEFTPAQVYHIDVKPYPTFKVASMPMRVAMGIDWLEKVALAQQKEYMDLMAIDPDVRKRNHHLRKKIKIVGGNLTRLSRTLSHAKEYPDDFYCTWDQDSFRFVPMTARLYFKRMFIDVGLMGAQHRPIIMSATIGNVETFARELGLGNFYEFIDVPSVFPPESMPVYILKDAPALGYSTKPSGWQKWADVIAGQINDLNPDWSGIIHVASRKQATDLELMLSKRGLDKRVYIPRGNSTLEKIGDWQSRKVKVPNTLAISYSFFMGLDAYDDEINIIAKIPFPTLDEVGRAKMEYDKDLYNHETALSVEQAAGRIRRGLPEHYEVSGEPMRKFVGIADRRYGMIKQEFSSHFRACLTKL